MTRTQIQLPEPLFHQIKRIASARDWSVAELIRRGARLADIADAATGKTCEDMIRELNWDAAIASIAERRGRETARPEAAHAAL